VCEDKEGAKETCFGNWIDKGEDGADRNIHLKQQTAPCNELPCPSINCMNFRQKKETMNIFSQMIQILLNGWHGRLALKLVVLTKEVTKFLPNQEKAFSDSLVFKLNIFDKKGRRRGCNPPTHGGKDCPTDRNAYQEFKDCLNPTCAGCDTFFE